VFGLYDLNASFGQVVNFKTELFSLFFKKPDFSQKKGAGMAFYSKFIAKKKALQHQLL